MIKKITLLLIISLFLISTVSASAIDDLKIPSGFEDIGHGVYVSHDSASNSDIVLSVVEYSKYDWEDYTTNDTQNKYEVTGENNTYNYTDGSVNEVGSFELAELDGEKYIIDFTKSNSADDLNTTFTQLIQFNELNNITPIEK